MQYQGPPMMIQYRKWCLSNQGGPTEFLEQEGSNYGEQRRREFLKQTKLASRLNDLLMSPNKSTKYEKILRDLLPYLSEEAVDKVLE